MRGDQLARQWRIIRAIEASPSGLTVTEIAEREETGIRTIYWDLEALHSPGHAKARSAPREPFRVLLAFLDIFFSPSHSFRKIIKGFSAKNPLCSLRLCVRKGFVGGFFTLRLWTRDSGLCIRGWRPDCQE